MGTTALVAELLVVGIQAVAWIAIFVIAGSSRAALSELLSLAQDSSGLVIGFIVAAAYTAGVLMDRLTDSLFSPIDKRIRRNVIKKKYFSVPRARLFVMQHGENMSSFLEYVRSRLRIARATGVNLAIGTLATIVLLAKCNVGFSVLAATALVGLALAGTAFYVWRRITRTYYKRLFQAWQIARSASGGA